MATFTFEEQRVIIRFLHLRGMKPIEIHQQLSETCNDGVMDVKNVRSWVRQFKEGRTSCENKPKEPRSCTSRSEDMTAHDFRNFSSSCKMVSTDPMDMPALAAILFHSQAAVFHNHLLHSRNHVVLLTYIDDARSDTNHIFVCALFIV